MDSHLVAKTFVFDDDSKLLILKRSSTDVHRPGGFDLPGGRIDDDENVIAGAVREAQEEAGLVLDPATMQLVYTDARAGFSASYGQDVNVVRLIFVTSVVNQAVTLSDEHDEYFWMTIDEVINQTNHPFQKMVLQYLKDNQIAAQLWSAS